MIVSAPFPWFGGKSRAAPLIWERLGHVDNLVIPFFGSGAELWGSPYEIRTITVNDADGHLVNVWRAMRAAPEEVAEHADWPVSEADLHARHLWLVNHREEMTARLMGDPEWFDARAAGWWIWGACCWIGTGWCSGEGPWRAEEGRMVLGDLGGGVNRQLPHLGGVYGSGGQGIHRLTSREPGSLREWFAVLQAILRPTRIVCGDWRRIVSPIICERHGLTGLILDPPYKGGDTDYAISGKGGEVAAAVEGWCRENGRRSQLLRIALCGHEGDYELPGWRRLAWKRCGGYGNQERDGKNDNRHREMVWFSPHCLEGVQRGLFE